MALDPISTLEAVIASLEEQMASDPRFVLLQNLKRARAEFDGPPASQINEASLKPKLDDQSAEPRPTGRQMSPARKQALALSEAFLASSLEVEKSKDIYAYVESKGCELPGGANNLASLLGRFPEKFISHGRQGWTLKMSDADVSDEMPAEGEDVQEATDANFGEETSVASMSSLLDQQGTRAEMPSSWIREAGSGGGT